MVKYGVGQPTERCWNCLRPHSGRNSLCAECYDKVIPMTQAEFEMCWRRAEDDRTILGGD